MKEILIFIILGLVMTIMTVVVRADRVDLKGLFASVDENNDGVLTFRESMNLLPKIEKSLKKSIGAGTAELKKYFDYVDSDRDGFISQSEFKTAVKEKLAQIMAKHKSL